MVYDSSAKVAFSRRKSNGILWERDKPKCYFGHRPFIGEYGACLTSKIFFPASVGGCLQIGKGKGKGKGGEDRQELSVSDTKD
jgi:hypothetical protein